MPETDRRVVVLNAGSSSLKFAAYPCAPEAPPLVSGAVEGIGGSAKLKIAGAPDRDVEARDLHAAMLAVAALPDGPLSGTLAGFGHRIVHGGPDLTHAVLVDDANLAKIEAVSPLAPLHNPPALGVLKALRERFPGVPPWRTGSPFPTNCISRACDAMASTACPTPTSPARFGFRRWRSRTAASWWRTLDQARRCAGWWTGIALTRP